jgi:Mismatch repair ATPase (MutS family)
MSLRRLLSQGYRVGVVDQVETAALKKVSEHRNTPFNRKLTHLYTAATWVVFICSFIRAHSWYHPGTSMIWALLTTWSGTALHHSCVSSKKVLREMEPMSMWGWLSSVRVLAMLCGTSLRVLSSRLSFSFLTLLLVADTLMRTELEVIIYMSSNFYIV